MIMLNLWNNNITKRGDLAIANALKVIRSMRMRSVRMRSVVMVRVMLMRVMRMETIAIGICGLLIGAILCCGSTK